jgi:hypothetical protein
MQINLILLVDITKHLYAAPSMSQISMRAFNYAGERHPFI